MPNDSSTGGYLQPPLSTGGELDDNALENFIGDVVAGITGLDRNLYVRPRWQPTPPQVPAFNTNWCAVGLKDADPDTFAFVGHDPTGEGSDIEYSNEILAIYCTFYGPSKFMYANILARGLQIAQNREALQLQGYGLVSCGKSTMGADLLNEVEVQTAEVEFSLRRSQTFTYPILSLESATVEVRLDGPPDVTLEVDTTNHQ
jgi:hypothetical protein